MNKRIKVVIPFVVMAALFIGYTVLSSKNPENNQEFLKKYDLSDLTVEEMVSELDMTIDEDESLYAYITGTAFTLGDDQEEITYDLPEDKFYLSLAPYINRTHPCGNHNLITCRGELQNETFHILLKDSNGNIIVNDNYTSYANGFIGLWLPKDMIGTITITYDGKIATSEISTRTDRNTCLTTLKLI